jgi:hypothetical protein
MRSARLLATERFLTILPSFSLSLPRKNPLFQFRNSFRHGRLRQVQALGGFSHAACLNDRRQHIQIFQFEATLDPVVPRHELTNIPILYESIT